MIQFDRMGPVVHAQAWPREGAPTHSYQTFLRANLEKTGFVFAGQGAVPNSSEGWKWFAFRKPAAGGEVEG